MNDHPQFIEEEIVTQIVALAALAKSSPSEPAELGSNPCLSLHLWP